MTLSNDRKHTDPWPVHGELSNQWRIQEVKILSCVGEQSHRKPNVVGRHGAAVIIARDALQRVPFGESLHPVGGQVRASRVVEQSR